MKKPLLFLATLVCAVALYIAYQYSKGLTPDTVMQELFDMNAPARYAFVSDESAPKLAVIDMDSLQQTGLLDLKTPARRLAIHKAYGLLAYSDGSGTITIRNLADHSESEQRVSHPVTRLQYDADSTWLIASGDDRLTLLDSRSGEQRLLEGYGHIHAWLYSPLSQQLWILDDTPALYRYSPAEQNRTRYPLPDGWHDLTAAAISPDDRHLLFGATTADGQHLAVDWDIDKADIARQIPLTAPLVQPYIDNSGQTFAYIDQNGGGHLINRINPDTILPFTAPNPTDRYATGWLDTRLIAVGSQLHNYDLSDPAAPPRLTDDRPLPGRTRALFITADSKTALLAHNDSRDISIYNLHDNSLRSVPLTGITRPENLIMGAGNTLCH